MKHINELLKFMDNSPTSFQAIENIVNELKADGYLEYNESNPLKFEKGQKYFTTRNQTSIIAFNIGKKLENPSFNLVASHSDAPAYKVKPNAIIKSNGYIKLNTEGYGGMIKQAWLDRPLSLAGRVLIRENDTIVSKLIDVKEKVLMIPSVAIHLNRDSADKPLNQQIDLLPIIAQAEEFDFNEYLAKKLEVKTEDVISFDLYVYPVLEAYTFDKFFASYHIDNLECAFTTLQGFKSTFNENSVNVYACFDNEEIGSRTRQGACSRFLFDMLDKVSKDLNFDLNTALASSLMVSADNAHAVHPNHPEKSDETNRVKMNEGIVIKYNANQSYTTDALSAALFIDCIKETEVKYQYYTNRSDMAGGGTLGYVSTAQVSIMSVDIGLAQLAMHSTLEMAGINDVEAMVKASNAFYKSHIAKVNEATFKITK